MIYSRMVLYWRIPYRHSDKTLLSSCLVSGSVHHSSLSSDILGLGYKDLRTDTYIHSLRERERENKNCWVGWLCIYVWLYIIYIVHMPVNVIYILYIFLFIFMHVPTYAHSWHRHPTYTASFSICIPNNRPIYTKRLRILPGTEAAAAEPMAEALMTESHCVQTWHAKTTRRIGIARCMRLTILRIEKFIRNRTSWLDFEVLPKKVQERYHVFMCILYLNFMYIEIRHTFRFPKTKMFLGGAPNSKGANPGRYQWPTAQTWFRSRDSPDFSWQWSLLRRNSQKRTIKHCKSVVKPTKFYMYVCILHVDVILYT